MEKKYDNDELDFIIKQYETEIRKHLETTEISLSFYSSSEEYFNTFENIKNVLKYDNDFIVTFYQDYSIGEENIVTDFGIGTLIAEDGKEYKVIKIVTPFTRKKTYDFIVAKTNEMNIVLNLLEDRRKKADFVYNGFPIVGLDFTNIKKDTIDFLLNEEFRDYCKSKYIKLKRGIILEGKPGTGKTLTIQWIKDQALKNNIEFHVFENADEFVKNKDDYYDDEKKIFIFEDFDTLLRERKDTNSSPNQILGMVLNILEGVNEINNVVSIFTTNEVSLFDSAFIRPGRIDRVFNYQLPDKSIYKEFLNAYIKEEEQWFDEIENILSKTNQDISYAILKGICDDINIYKFSGNEVTFEIISKIIDEKLRSSNKNKDVKKTSDYIL